MGNSREDSNNRIGQKFGNYRIVQFLGRGGFADVYLGQHVFLKTKAAIKVLRTQLTEGDEADFLKEAQTIANLLHPNIVRVLEFGKELDTGTLFLVIDYAPHGSLRRRHQKGSVLSPSEVVLYVTQIAAALQYAHDANLIHRDVKPENMLVGQDGAILLSDFGTAMIAPNTQSVHLENVIGSLLYIAPEQFRGQPRFASDQYSLATCAYEWLTGYRPFKGSSSEIVGQLLSLDPLPLRSKNSSISLPVEQVVMKALSKDPKERYSSVQEFAEALERANKESLSLPKIKDTVIRGDIPTIVLADSPTISFFKERASLPSQSPSLSEKEPFKSSQQAEQSNSVIIAPPISSKKKWSFKQLFTLFQKNRQDDATETVSSASLRSKGKNQYFFNLFRLAKQDVFLSPIPPASVEQNLKQLSKQTASANTRTTRLGHKGEVVYGAAWSPPDDKYIASVGADKKVQVWDVMAARMHFVCRHKDKVYAVAWSSDGRYLASASADHTGQVWDRYTKRKLFTYEGHSPLYAVAWYRNEKDKDGNSPNSANVAWAGADSTVSVCNVSTRSNIYIYRAHTDWVRTVAWSPDGTYLASGGNDTTVRKWDMAGHTHMVYDKHTDSIRTLAWSPDSTLIASAGNDKTVHVWNAITGEPIRVYNQQAEATSGAVLAVAWSPNGKFIASAGENQIVIIWDALSEQTPRIYKHDAPITSLAWSVDSQFIASASYDGNVQIRLVTEVPQLAGNQGQTTFMS